MLPAVEPPRRIDPKTAATLKARCALAGIELHVIDGDAGEPLFIVSRWSLTRQLHSVAEVESFLRRIGGPKA